MKKKNANFVNWMTIIVLISGIFVSSCTKDEAVKTSELDLVNLKNHHLGPAPPTANSCDLIAGQYMDAGEVLTWEKDGEFFVRYITSGDWKLYEAHVYYGLKSDMPLNNNGGPKIGQFTVSVDDLPGLTTVTYVFDLVDPVEGDCVVLATHAVVATNDDMTDEETAWSKCGTPIIALKTIFTDGTWAATTGVSFSETGWCKVMGTNVYLEGEDNSISLVNSVGTTVGNILASDNGTDLTVFISSDNKTVSRSYIYFGSYGGFETYFTGECPNYWDFPTYYGPGPYVIPVIIGNNSVEFSSSSWGWYSEYCK